ncbi:MAG: M20/M25/M40 family metallo-hydrolase [Eubacteriales bacterium]
MTFHIDKEALLKRFCRYVTIDSETGNEKEMTLLLTEELRELGLSVRTEPLPESAGTNGCNILGVLEGDSQKEGILFSSHMDTVIPGKNIRPIVCEDGRVRSEGDTILGGDDKAGIAAIMEALICAKSVADHPRIEILFTVREEVGLVGAKAFDCSLLQSKRGVVLDSGGTMENITTIAPGQNRLTFTIHGKTAHAGIAPETGISAIQVGAEAVAHMELLRIDEETTANIGTFMAESPTNIVCDQATLILEVRSRDNDKLKSHCEKVENCVKEACEKRGACYEMTLQSSYTAFNIPETSAIVADALRICTELGREGKCIGSGGGSDANVLNAYGIPTINVAIGMEKVHTIQEELIISEMELAAELCYRLMI